MADFDLIVIGSGPGGYVAAIKAAQLGIKTACVEKDPELGGTCLNIGCIPSKSLLHSSHFYEMIEKKASAHGIDISKASLNFETMQKRKQGVVAGFNAGVKSLFKKYKVEHLQGTASFQSPEKISVQGRQYSAKHFIIATGSEPMPLPFLPFDEKKIVSSTGALALPNVPKKMVVVGAGIIGVELGSVYRRLGSEVIFIEFLDRICPTMDRGISRALQQILTKQGLAFHLNSKVIKGEGTTLTYTSQEKGEQTLSGDVVLVSIGRKPYTKDLGLDRAGVKVDDKGFIPIDGQFRTSKPHIFAIGDVIGGAMLAHKASEEGIAAVEIIAGHRPLIDYISIPSVIYTDPEVAAVGLTEEMCKEIGIAVKIGQFPFKANSRARCIGEDEGFVKLIADEKSQCLIGAHIIGQNAGELIQECGLAIQRKATAKELSELSHAHPTLSESIKEAALIIANGKAIHM